MKYMKLVFASILGFFLQGCCLIFECPCNYKHKLRNVSGEELSCLIIRADRERRFQLSPNEVVKFNFGSELFAVEKKDNLLVFDGILGSYLACPLELTSNLEIMVSEENLFEETPSIIKPTIISRQESLFWVHIIRDVVKNKANKSE